MFALLWGMALIGAGGAPCLRQLSSLDLKKQPHDHRVCGAIVNRLSGRNAQELALVLCCFSRFLRAGAFSALRIFSCALGDHLPYSFRDAFNSA